MKRFLALTLAFLMVFSCVSQLTAALAESTEEATDLALHFIVRHWHTVDNEGNRLSNAKERSDESLAVEGYITPVVDASGKTVGYTVKVKRSDETNFQTMTGDTDLSDRPYITEIVTTAAEGSITLNEYPQVDSITGVNLEDFSGYSVSAGHEAVEVKGNTIKITYPKLSNVHLVKSHAFYGAVAQKRPGEGSDAGWPENGERDTRLDLDESGKEVKFYNTSAGLHTDKTAEITHTAELDDGRTFDIDLEAWYSIGTPPYVAMILDASGSMAFTVGEPTPIKIGDDGEPALINIADEGRLTRTALAQLQGRKLPEGANITRTAEWEKYFLTKEEVGLLLNPHNTDNSRLSSSGYTYFVYDATNASEYAPLGYWDGTGETGTMQPKAIGLYDFVKDRYGKDPDKSRRTWAENSLNLMSFAKQTKQIPMPVVGEKVEFAGEEIKFGVEEWPGALNMSEADGFNIGEATTAGLLLDAEPTSKNFTIQFRIKRTVKTAESKPEKDLEIMYIGTVDEATDDAGTEAIAGHYLRIVRGSSGSYQRVKIVQDDNESTQTVISLNKIFNVGYKDSNGTTVYNSDKLITLRFEEEEGGTVAITAWVDGELPLDDTYQATGVMLDDYRIVLAGIADSYSGDKIFLDDIYIFDGALTPAEITNYLNIQNGNAGAREAKNQNDSVSVIAGFAGNTDKVLGTIEKRYLKATAEEQAGWYFINPLKDWTGKYDNGDIQTAKTLNGTPSQAYFVNHGYPNKAAIPDNSKYRAIAEQGNDQSVYSPDVFTNDSVRFYIDSQGYLRCFFASAIDRKDSDDNAEAGCSFVYEKSDESYIKSEALQRALGAFLTRLHEESPTSQVAAVRFSTSQSSTPKEQKKLVLLKWTDNVRAALSMMALTYGDGTDGDGSGQYNYGLTGDTSTWTGLQAYIDNLDNNGTLDGQIGEDDDAQKYLIIFTDGLDTDRRDSTENSQKAVNLAKQLREKGYTIFAVLLDGGTVEKGAKQYDDAIAFLKELTGEPEDEDGLFVFSTSNADEMTKVNNLVDLFTNTILNKNIIQPLTDYAVKDYIDPRFDLVDADGHVWHLNPNGQVQIQNDDGTFTTVTLSKTAYQTITLSKSGEVTVKAQEAKLYYDSGTDGNERNMYYLLWEGQEIPNCTEDATELNVWSARMTLRAKEDFIGGSAVLTNGHDANMNYVFFPGNGNDEDPSDENVSGASGTDRSVVDDEKGVRHPSKGFPRVVVNVPGPADGTSATSLIYMGEALNNKALMTGIVKEAIESARQDSTLWTEWYWEYLYRYDEYFGTDSVSDLLDSEDGTLERLYYYLPDYDNGKLLNATGTKLHERDKVGTITYKLEELKGDELEPDDGADADETKDTEPRILRLSATFEPADIEKERIEANEKLVQEQRTNGEKVYLWDREYKPEKGNFVSGTAAYDVVTQIVSGEIAMQMLIPKSVITYLQRLIPGETITYQAALRRTYGSVEGELVGTFDLVFPVPTEVPTDQVIVTVPREAIKFTADYASYAVTYGLPIGTYTLETVPDGTTQSTLFNFGPITVVELNDNEYADIFARFPDQFGESVNGQIQPFADFKALYDQDTTAPQLGTGVDKATDASYTNERYALLRVTLYAESGDLTVTKTVEGNGGDQDKAFTFTVTLSDTSVNGQVGDMKFQNGVATFTLKHGESKTAVGLPAGLTYTVTESGNAGYVTTATGDKGTIESNSETVAAFRNTRNVGGLTVTKTVAGTGGETDKAFTFTVTLSDTGITGTYGDMTFSGGVATFELKHGESKTATGLPSGVTYTVAESGNAGYITTVTGDKGTIETDSSAVAAFTNTRNVGGLTVTKTVAGTGGETDKAFTFTVTLSDTGITGTYGEMTFKAGVATFTLKHGESKKATGLPSGVTYTVTESGNAGYDTTATGDKGTIGTDNAAVAAFTNTRNIGSLTVTKTVAGTAGETDKAFSFMVMLSDTSIAGTYGEMTFKAGVATFTLKHGESKTATGLPVGVYYSVAELEADQDGYTTTVVGEKGNISVDEASKAIFVNTKDVIDVPQTGDDSHLGLWVTLLLASILGMGVSFIALRRKGSRTK